MISGSSFVEGLTVILKILSEIMQDRKKDTDVYNGLLDSEGEGEGGMIWENGNSNLYTVM